MRTPSPALVIACLALFVALSGVAYAAATIGSDDIINGSIRNRDFKDGTLRGNEAKPNGFGGGAIKERSLAAGEFGKVNSAATADGLARHGVISNIGTLVRGRGITAASKTGDGQYLAVFDVDVRNCTYFATLGDESASGPGTGQIAVTSAASSVNGVRVVTRNSTGDLADRSFHLIVSC